MNSKENGVAMLVPICERHQRVKTITLNKFKGAFFWAYSGIGIVGISQTIVPSRATLISEWL